MKTILVGGTSDTLHATNTEFHPLTAGYFWSTTETGCINVIPTAGTFRNLRVKLYDSPGAGKNYTFTIRKNGVDTSLTVNCSDTSVVADIINSFAVAAADYIAIKVVPSGTPTVTRAAWCIEFEGDNSAESIVLGGSFCSKSGLEYFGPLSPINYNVSSNPQPIPTGGTFSKLYVKTAAWSPGSDPGYQVRFMGSVANPPAGTSLLVNLKNAEQTGNNTADSVVLSAEDLVEVFCDRTGSPTGEGYIFWGLVFTPTNKGEFLIMGHSAGDDVNNLTEYTLLANGWQVWSGTAYYNLVQACILKNFLVYSSVAPGTGKSWTFTPQRNGSNTSLSVLINNTSSWDIVGDYSNQESCEDGDTLGIKYVPSGNPLNSECNWALVGYISTGFVPKVMFI